MHTFDLSMFSSDLPRVNPTTLNGVILYYRLMTKWSGLLGDSTELSRMGLSQRPKLDGGGLGARTHLAGGCRRACARGVKVVAQHTRSKRPPWRVVVSPQRCFCDFLPCRIE
jgi:hypothetical protein